MPIWKGQSDGRLEIGFVSAEDIINFVNNVVQGPAKQFGLEIMVKQASGSKEEPKHEIVRV